MANLKNFFGQMGKAVVVALQWMIGVPVGMLIFNPLTISIITIKRSWRRRLANLMDGEGPMALAAKVMAVVTFAAMLVAMFVILNPLIVCLIALVAPKWVAETCYGELSDEWWRLCIEIPLSWQGWIGHLLPWYARRHFVDERFSQYPTKDRMRLTLEEPRRFLSLSDEEKEKVFCKASAEQRREWMERGVEMTLPMFVALAHVGVSEVVDYAKRHNNRLTEEQLEALLSFGEEYVASVIAKLTLSDEQLLLLASQRNFGNLLAILQRQGCGKAVVDSIKKAVRIRVGGNAEAKVRQALGEWRQKGQVSQLVDKPELFKQLVENEELCVAAQVKMSVNQYRIYHECGRKLAEEAIRWFFLYSAEMARAIFELEENNGMISQEINDLVCSSPELSNLLLKVQLEKKAAEAEKK